MVKIEDGTGRGHVAAVNSVNRLQVSARTARRAFYVSRDQGQVYTTLSEDATAVANEETIYLKNTSPTRNVFIDTILISSDVASQWRLKFVTGTAAGTVITPINLNKTSSNDAEVESRGDGVVTGLTDDGDIAIFRVTAGSGIIARPRATIILGQNDAIALECEINCAAEIAFEFHLEDD